jgi:hypothetical protein
MHFRPHRSREFEHRFYAYRYSELVYKFPGRPTVEIVNLAERDA